MTDPLEHFGEQQESYEMLDQHRELLAADAAEIARDHPELRTVGLVLHADASEAAPIRAALEAAAGQSFASKGFVGVVPRQLVLDILRANHPAALDWLENSRGEGNERILPLVALTQNGIRLGQVPYSLGSALNSTSWVHATFTGAAWRATGPAVLVFDEHFFDSYQ